MDHLTLTIPPDLREQLRRLIESDASRANDPIFLRVDHKPSVRHVVATLPGEPLSRRVELTLAAPSLTARDITG